MKFNIDKFNIRSKAEQKLTGESHIKIRAQAKDPIIEIRPQEVERAHIKMTGQAEGVVLVYAGPTSASISMSAEADATTVVYASETTCNITVDGRAIGNLLGEDYIEIKGNLAPGDELIIDNCDLTATVNGENAIEMLSDDGDFFSIHPGRNIITVQADNGQRLDVTVYWKDRWI